MEIRTAEGGGNTAQQIKGVIMMLTVYSQKLAKEIEILKEMVRDSIFEDERQYYKKHLKDAERFYKTSSRGRRLVNRFSYISGIRKEKL